MNAERWAAAIFLWLAMQVRSLHGALGPVSAHEPKWLRIWISVARTLLESLRPETRNQRNLHVTLPTALDDKPPKRYTQRSSGTFRTSKVPLSSPDVPSWTSACTKHTGPARFQGFAEPCIVGQREKDTIGKTETKFCFKRGKQDSAR